MSRSRYAPDPVSTRYLRELKSLPLPAAPVEPVEPRRLTVLGRTRIDGQDIVLGTCTDAPRLWAAFQGTEAAPSSLIGYLTGLACGDPHLWICDATHRAWAMHGDNTAELKRAAARVWSDHTRDCEG